MSIQRLRSIWSDPTVCYFQRSSLRKPDWAILDVRYAHIILHMKHEIRKSLGSVYIVASEELAGLVALLWSKPMVWLGWRERERGGAWSIGWCMIDG